MPAPRSVIVFGVRYTSLTAACRAYGHSEPKIRHRMKNGALLEDALIAENRHTGAKKHPNYMTWNGMISRCHSTSGNQNQVKYSEKGIIVCDLWRNDFWLFVRDVGIKPSKDHTIERLDNSKGYQPGNCVWATRAEQARNKSTNVFLEFDGRRLCMLDWSREVGITASAIAHRLKIGWTVKDALMTPSRKAKKIVKSYMHPDLRDNPQRVGGPEFGPERRDFSDLPLTQRLDSVREAIRQPSYQLALIEALPESSEYTSWLNQLVDSGVSDATVGHVARELICAYISEVAKHRRDEI